MEDQAERNCWYAVVADWRREAISVVWYVLWWLGKRRPIIREGSDLYLIEGGGVDADRYRSQLIGLNLLMSVTLVVEIDTL